MRRRLADAALVVVWLLALFQLVQIRGEAQDETTTEIVITVVVSVGLGLATTLLWLRSRRR